MRSTFQLEGELRQAHRISEKLASSRQLPLPVGVKSDRQLGEIQDHLRDNLGECLEEASRSG